MTAVIELRDVVKTFDSEPPVEVLKGASLAVAQGEIACVMGVSGKGKSTLLHVAGGLIMPNSGSVVYGGENLCAANQARIDQLHAQGIGFILQTPYLFQALTVRENLVYARKMSGAKPGETDLEAELSCFGLLDRADHMPYELSVGQKRRLVIARALRGGHRLILADEPTNDLDATWSDYLFERLKGFAEDGGTVIVVTHDRHYAGKADSLYALDNGKLVRQEA